MNEIMTEVINEVMTEVMTEIMTEVMTEVINEIMTEVMTEIMTEVMTALITTGREASAAPHQASSSWQTPSTTTSAHASLATHNVPAEQHTDSDNVLAEQHSADPTALDETREQGVKSLDQSVEDNFAKRLEMQLDFMDELMRGESEGGTEEDEIHEVTEEADEQPAAELDVEQGVARLEEIRSSSMSQGVMPPHHDAEPELLAPQHKQGAGPHVGEQQVYASVESSGKGVTVDTTSPVVESPVSKLVEDTLLMELRRQNEELVALLKSKV
jgi:hypothetical protein